MKPLTAESRFIADRWDVVSEVLGAVTTLRRELQQHLVSFREELSAQDWWPGWEFMERDSSQIYIGRADWKIRGKHLVWIGVERFDPEHVFGSEVGAQVYLWVLGGNQENRVLVTELSECLKRNGDELRGTFNTKPNAYVLTFPVASVLPGEAERLGAREQEVLECIGEYARAVTKCEEVVGDYLQRMESQR